MQYEVFRHNDAPDEVFKQLDGFFKQVENEDKNLCNGAQRNLNAGVYVNGNLQPSNEKVSGARTRRCWCHGGNLTLL